MKITEKASELDILPVDNQLARDTSLHPNLLHNQWSLLLVAPKGSGKSSLIMRLLMGIPKRKDKPAQPFYRGHFDKIHIFSPTWCLDLKTKKIHIPEDQIHNDEEEYESIIEEIMLTQELAHEEGEEQDRVLLIFTDLAGSKTFARSHGIYNRLAFNQRHYNVSMIIDTQKYRSINTAFRSNMTGVVCFTLANLKEYQALAEEHSNLLTPAEFKQLFAFCTDEPFSFLFINYQKPIGQRFHRKFNQLTLDRSDPTKKIGITEEKSNTNVK